MDVDKMTGKGGRKIPQEIIDQIIKEVLRGCRYKLNERLPPSQFLPDGCDDVTPEYRPPVYTGLLLASRALSKEVQRLLYKESVFRAYLWRLPDCMARVPRLEVYDRIQKFEFFLDLWTPYKPNLEYINNNIYVHFYLDWFEVFGGSRVNREYCRITFTPLIFRYYYWEMPNVIHYQLCEHLIGRCKELFSFKTVVLQLEEKVLDLEKNKIVPPSRVSLRAATGQIRDPVHAGDEFEALKKYIETVLQPSLGYCMYYDRDNFSCMEFHPRDTLNPIPPGQSPFVKLADD